MFGVRAGPLILRWYRLRPRVRLTWSTDPRPPVHGARRLHAPVASGGRAGFVMVPVGRFSSCLGVSDLPDEFVAHLGEGFVESAARRRGDEAVWLAIVASSVVRWLRVSRPLTGYEEVHTVGPERAPVANRAQRAGAGPVPDRVPSVRSRGGGSPRASGPSGIGHRDLLRGGHPARTFTPHDGIDPDASTVGRWCRTTSGAGLTRPTPPVIGCMAADIASWMTMSVTSELQLTPRMICRLDMRGRSSGGWAAASRDLPDVAGAQVVRLIERGGVGHRAPTPVPSGACALGVDHSRTFVPSLHSKHSQGGGPRNRSKTPSSRSASTCHTSPCPIATPWMPPSDERCPSRRRPARSGIG